MKTNKGLVGNKEWRNADARVLGQILAAQNIEFALPNTAHIAEFFAEMLLTIPGIIACRICLEDVSIQKGEMESEICVECQASCKKVNGQKELSEYKPDFKCGLAKQPGIQFEAVDSLQHHFGFFVFQIDDPEAFNLYKPFIGNLANYVAISLENRLQRDLLQKTRDELERRVEERTGELRISNETIKDLYNNAPCGYHSLDKDGFFVLINNTELRWLGYSREEIVGKVTFRDLLTANSQKTFDANFPGFKERGWVSDLAFEMVRKDGTILPVLLNATAITDGNGSYVMSRSTIFDITERKQAEDALQERERHSQSLLRFSRNLEQAQTYAEVLNAVRNEVRNIIGYQNLWAYLFTEDKKYAKALVAEGPMSDTVMSEDGISTLTIAGDKMLEEIAQAKEIVVVEDARVDERTNKEIVAQLGNRTIVNVPIILFDRHLGSVGTGTFGEEGVRPPTESEQKYLTALASHMAVSLDRIHLLIERKRADETLRKSEEKYRQLVDTANEGIWVVDSQRQIIFVNARMAEMLGYRVEEMIGRRLDSFLFEEDLADHETIMQRRRQGMAEYYEHRYCAKDGQTVWTLVSATPLFDGEHRFQGSFAMLTDITERRGAEDALRKRNEELERFEQAVIGRELKMIELKKRIAELEEKYHDKKEDRHES